MTKTKVAVVASKEKEFTFKEVEIDDPKAHEVLIKVVATGLCHTDLSVKAGKLPSNYPVVLGHEGAGVVEKVGSHVTDLAVGDHVVLSFGSCGGCRPCREGDTSYCVQLEPLNFMNKRQASGDAIFKGNDEKLNGAFFQQSSFGTYALAHERNTVRVTKEVDLRLLGPLGCGIQTGAGTVMNTLNPRAGTSIAIFGVGSVGLSAIMAAKNVGCSTIVAVDINPSRLELAEKLGATHLVNSEKEDAPKVIKELTGVGVDYAVEASGIKAVAESAFHVLANRGILAVVGAPEGGTEYAFDANELINTGKKVVGVVEGDSTVKIFIPRLIALYQQGRFPFDELVQYYPFDNINEAVADMEEGKVIKPILEM
ncbi:NAD(P)-dependent alcohol dehydrogenase [Flavobacteriaceae bacterium TP-CH-4]|uniref:NAD(P)-dependent alcohol dehydrogenase n=1 Tax=Pelagihabitans pacificus TaxID=2696054 RepID=A0A967E579_9FLAO|nr:NAD(P)-dependent alcohol dehydrogenase [Pelagihabitans pacificus]NHF59162.1 NAD(P)-dependent alcohol dehydrogenase [Pelagihabitans pacificus]